MKVVALSVGLPREVEWRGEVVLTSIYKEPVDRRLRVAKLNIEGDEQSDLTVHGGVHKAVYAYPSEHYGPWMEDLGRTDLGWGTFGENLTVAGLAEGDVRVGDWLRVGSAEFVVTQPRLPCFKLGIRLGRPDALKRMLQTGRTGFYLAVTAEGEVGPGDAIERVGPPPEGDDAPTVADVVRLFTTDGADQDLLRRAIRASALPESWKRQFRGRPRDPDA